MDEVLIYNEPYGVALVMGAWNYPLQLSLVPFSAAIAAGNTVILKPSEISVNCAKFMAEKIRQYLDNVSGFNTGLMQYTNNANNRNAIMSFVVEWPKQRSCLNTNSTTSSTQEVAAWVKSFTKRQRSI